MKTLPIKSFNGYRCKEIPRYLYTITTQANYESICNDGFIHIARDPLRPQMRGIFMFDLINFTKRWTSNSFFKCKSFANELLGSITDKSKNLVVLKIPTENLDGDLRIRSLNYLFRKCDKVHSDYHLDTGFGANMRKHFTQHKEPIEYIYKENIPIDKIEKIGELYIEDTRALARGQLNLKSLLSQLFAGTPQHKAIELMK